MADAIFKPGLHRCEVSHESEFVKIQLGDAVFTIHYRDAFALAQAIRSHAGQVKREIHDTGLYIKGYGIISDAEDRARNEGKVHW